MVEANGMHIELTYKPGSVPVGGLFTRPKAAIICLGRKLPGASSNQPGSEAGRFMTPLFGLAPDGVYPAEKSPFRR